MFWKHIEIVLLLFLLQIFEEKRPLFLLEIYNLKLYAFFSFLFTSLLSDDGKIIELNDF